MNTETKNTTVKVGTIFRDSWGYDQTNVDFYQVVEVSDSGKSIKVRQIGKHRDARGSGHDSVTPAVGEFLPDRPDTWDGKPDWRNGTVWKRVNFDTWDGKARFKASSFSDAYIVDDPTEGTYETAAGWGH